MKFNFGTINSTDTSSTWIIVGVIILILIISFGCWCTTDNFKQTFGNLFENKDKKKKVKELKITMFMSPQCKWCQKTVALLEKEKVKDLINIVDITTPEGSAEATKYGADKQPIPSFISETYKTGAVGYRETLDELLDAFKPVKADIESQQSEIILFSRDGCPYCTMAKEAIEKEGLQSLIQIVDINTNEGRGLADKLLPPGTGGVPAFVNVTNKKHLVGFKPNGQMAEILEQLK